MKRIITVSAVMFFTLSLSAQHGSSSNYSYSNYEYNNGYHSTSYNNDYRDNNRRGGDYERGGDRNYRGGRDYNGTRRYKRKRYTVRFNQLSYRDQKRVTKLERKYIRTEKCAWDDGHLNRRERKNLRSIEGDIDRIWARYERYRNDGYGNFGSCG